MGNAAREDQTSDIRATAQSDSQETTDITGRRLPPEGNLNLVKHPQQPPRLMSDVREEEGHGGGPDTVHLEHTAGQPQGKARFLQREWCLKKEKKRWRRDSLTVK